MTTYSPVLEPVEIHVPKDGFEIIDPVLWDAETFKYALEYDGSGSAGGAGISLQHALRARQDEPALTLGLLKPSQDTTINFYNAANPKTWPVSPKEKEPRPLFMQFADIKGDIGQAIKFANTFGALGLFFPAHRPGSDPFDPNNADWSYEKNVEYVEPLFFWTDASRSMAHFIEIWENLGEAKNKGFTEIQNRFEGRIDLVHEAEREMVAANLTGLKQTKRCKITRTRQIKDAALTAITEVLLEHINTHLTNSISHEIRYDEHNLTLHPRLRIDNLNAFLWYDFARHLTSQKEIRSCEFCKEFFVSQPAEKQKRRFCTHNCRNKAHRRKPNVPT